MIVVIPEPIEWRVGESFLLGAHVSVRRLEFKDFCTRGKVPCQVKSLSLNALGIHPGKAKQYPSLASYIFNACSVKSFFIFLAEKLGKDPALQNDEYLRVRHTALWSAAEITWVCDHGGITLSHADRDRLQYAGSLHLLAFAWLYQRTNHLYLYQPVPKLHYLEHCITRAYIWGVNPNTW